MPKPITGSSGGGVPADPDTQYIWGLRYIDDLLLRDQRLYPLQDANWNVVAPSDPAGTIVQRFIYDAYGKPTALDPDFTPYTGTDYSWPYLFTGRRLDAETALMHYRNRYYDTRLGRFVTRDPIGYAAGDANLYRYVGNMPLASVDTYGLEKSRKVEYLKRFGHGLKAKFVVFVEVTDKGRLGVNVHIRRYTEQFGNIEKYRRKWNIMCKNDPAFKWRTLVWSKGGNKTGWALPNLALFLDGTDTANAYGGDYWTGFSEYDVNGDYIEGSAGKHMPDDDYMSLNVKTLLNSDKKCDSNSTKAWHPIGGKRSLTEVVHVAGSKKVYVKKPSKGKVVIELVYEDEEYGGKYGKVTIPLNGDDLGHPKVKK